MATQTMTISGIGARAVNAPLPRPIRTAIGNIPSAPLVLIDVQTDEGIVGRSYLFAYSTISLRPLVSLLEAIGTELKGKSVAPAERLRDLDRRFRLIGWHGLIGLAVSGIDMALWDILGKSVSLPVVALVGGSPVALKAYDSFGIVDPVADAHQLRGSIEKGFKGIKIKLGNGDALSDERTVRAVRDIIGPDVALMVDYNQSLTVPEAIDRISRLGEHDLHWVEEPVRAEDLHAQARVRKAVRTSIQSGESWWFPAGMAAAIAADACDLAMLDLMRIGGITGWLQAASQASAAALPVSSHIFIEASTHVMAVTPTAHWVEYVDSAGTILRSPYEPEDGKLMARGPGLGIEWDEAAVRRYAA